MNANKPKKETRADLRRKILELGAQQAHVYHFASRGIEKAGDALMASGAVLQLTALGGRELIPPVVIRDGLSRDTIEALQRDMVRSYSLAVVSKPKGAS